MYYTRVHVVLLRGLEAAASAACLFAVAELMQDATPGQVSNCGCVVRRQDAEPAAEDRPNVLGRRGISPPPPSEAGVATRAQGARPRAEEEEELSSARGSDGATSIAFQCLTFRFEREFGA